MTKIVRNLNPSDLMFLKSDINYTEVYLADGRKCVSSYTLKIFENSDIARCFLRISKSILVNPEHIISVNRSSKIAEVTLTNGLIIKASRRKQVVLRDLQL